MQGMRVRWLLAVTIIVGITLTGAAWGAAGEDQGRSAIAAAGDTKEATANNTSQERQEIHLFLTANGTKLVGDSVTPTKDRLSSIEALAFENTVITPREAGSGLATGRRQYQPLLVRKRIDKSSPLLMKALTNGERIDGEIKFFRSAAGGGTMEHYYTITISDGRLVDYKLDSHTAEAPPMEELHLTFGKISWTYVRGGITHEDTWSVER